MAPIIAATDIIWIAGLGVCSGKIYDTIVFDADVSAQDYLGVGLAVATLYVVFGQVSQAYQAPNLMRLRWQCGKSLLNWLKSFACLAILAFLMKSGSDFSRGAMLVFFLSGIFALVTVRWQVARLCRFIISSGMLKPSLVIVVGCRQQLSSREALSDVERSGLAIARVFELVEDLQATNGKATLRQQLRDVVDYVRDTNVVEIVVAVPWQSVELLDAIESEFRVLPIPVTLLPDMATGPMLERPIIQMGQAKAVRLQRAPMSVTQRVLKESLDRCGSAIALVFLMPFLAVIAAAIRLESTGPAFFLQTRVGLNGRPFRIVKFRTMSTLDNGPMIVQATKGDRRVTHLGRLLRRLSIDEVPQLFNVIKGEMSLVGPRPHALAHDNEYERLIATYGMRHKMRPGITGWAQVNGHRGETPELQMMVDRVESDLWYIEYWSLWLDIRIMLVTVIRLMKPNNVY